MQCVILAGGMATRMIGLTGSLPKHLLPVAGLPFADFQLRLLAQNGVDKVVYCLGYRGDQIRAYVGDGGRWGLSVRYVDEGSELRGTAGALRLAHDEGELERRFFVTYGDSYLRLDLRAMWRAFEASGAPAIMAVLRNRDRWDRSNVDFRSGKILRYDKSRSAGEQGALEYIDYGISGLSRELVRDLVPSDGPADLSRLFQSLIASGRLAGFEARRRFFEIGSPEGLADFRRFVARNRP